MYPQVPYLNAEEDNLLTAGFGHLKNRKRSLITRILCNSNLAHPQHIGEQSEVTLFQNISKRPSHGIAVITTLPT